jgi:hypothetical protein
MIGYFVILFWWVVSSAAYDLLKAGLFKMIPKGDARFIIKRTIRELFMLMGLLLVFGFIHDGLLFSHEITDHVAGWTIFLGTWVLAQWAFQSDNIKGWNWRRQLPSLVFWSAMLVWLVYFCTPT